MRSRSNKKYVTVKNDTAQPLRANSDYNLDAELFEVIPVPDYEHDRQLGENGTLIGLRSKKYGKFLSVDPEEEKLFASSDSCLLYTSRRG